MEGALLMPHILAFTSIPEDADALSAVTTAIARTLRLTAEQHQLPTEAPGASAAMLLAVADPTVRMAVLPYYPGNASHLVIDVIRQCPKPIVLVPVDPRATAPEQISRMLVPLDGTIESAETVAETVKLFAGSGADIVVLHVFDKTTVPKFWDQSVHARKSWDEEFLARYCNHPDARLELRTGSPGPSILDVAATEQADLIALGWGQNLSTGKARTVRSAVAQSKTPILLLPVPSADAPNPWWRPAGVETAAGS
jgi:nucleotide-binding universal stress UspA family protein